MTAADLAAVIVAGSCLALMVTATVLVMRLRVALGEVARLTDELGTEMAARMAELGERADTIETDLRRVDGLLDQAERVTARADTLSRMTYGAVARPVIRTAAVVKGTSRAARRLRGVTDDDGDDGS